MKKRALIAVAGIAALAVIVLLLPKQAGDEPFVLKRTDVDYKILATCTVSFPEPYAMAATSEGEVARIAIAEGQRVRKGDLLVQVDDFNQRQNLTIALNDYRNVKLKLVNAREEAYPRLKEQLNDAGSALAEAQNHDKRIAALFAAGAVSRVEMESARTRLDAAQARYNQIRLQLDSYSRSGAAAELINQLNILNARVELARRAVDDRRFVAPYDGTVVRLDVKQGETVAAGEKVVTVLERKPWVLEASVDQKELGFLEAGLPCLAVFDAYPGEKVKAGVSLVCSVIDFARGTCTLKLRVLEDRPFIKHGMTGSVEISGRKIAGVNAGVLALPARYLLRRPEGDFVIVRRGGRDRETAVEFVPIGEKWVSVRNLPEGTRIVAPR